MMRLGSAANGVAKLLMPVPATAVNSFYYLEEHIFFAFLFGCFLPFSTRNEFSGDLNLR
jgi:hypothetical protein